MAISKVVLNGTTLMDATTATATAEDIIAPKTALIATGVMTEGTGTGGGGIDVNDLAMGTAPSGRMVLDTATAIEADSFKGKTALTSIFASSVITFKSYGVQNCPALKTFVSTKPNASFSSDSISSCSALEAIDVVGKTVNTLVQFANNCFRKNTMLSTLIIRSQYGLPSLLAINAFAQTPFADGGTGGTLYVPQSLLSQYTQATNWSTILGYANNQILPIEGSIYETQYADGTSII